jgi:hypothetical protein
LSLDPSSFWTQFARPPASGSVSGARRGSTCRPPVWSRVGNAFTTKRSPTKRWCGLFHEHSSGEYSRRSWCRPASRSIMVRFEPNNGDTRNQAALLFYRVVEVLTRDEPNSDSARRIDRRHRAVWLGATPGRHRGYPRGAGVNVETSRSTMDLSACDFEDCPALGGLGPINLPLFQGTRLGGRCNRNTNLAHVHTPSLLKVRGCRIGGMSAFPVTIRG